jgi:hypothetical protein
MKDVDGGDRSNQAIRGAKRRKIGISGKTGTLWPIPTGG